MEIKNEKGHEDKTLQVLLQTTQSTRPQDGQMAIGRVLMLI